MQVRNLPLRTIFFVCAYTLIVCGAVSCQKPKHAENEMSNAAVSTVLITDSIMMSDNTRMVDSSMKMSNTGSKNIMVDSISKSTVTAYYTCTMHPQVHNAKPGKCPICGMNLVLKKL